MSRDVRKAPASTKEMKASMKADELLQSLLVSRYRQFTSLKHCNKINCNR